MLQSNLKRELLDMFHADSKLLDEQVGRMNERTKAMMRTARLGSRKRSPGEVPPVEHRKGQGVLGKGLFANKDFDKGEFITIFPIDCCLYMEAEPSTSTRRLKVCYGGVVNVGALQEAAGDAIVQNRRFAHLVDENGVPISMALPHHLNPEDANCPDHMGHWADDAAGLQANAQNAQLAAKQYSEKSFEAANATHVSIGEGVFVWTIATRAIAKGEEIFVCHGVNWWKSWNVCAAQNPHACSAQTQQLADKDVPGSS